MSPKEHTMFDRFAMANLTGGELNALVKKVGGEDAVRRILRGELVVGEPGTVTKAKASASQKVLAGLLELTGEPVKIEATERFVARDKLVVDRNAEVPISYIGDNLKTNFTDLVEENVPAATLKQRKLLKSSVDGPILSALGGQAKAKIALAQVWQFLKTADRTKWFLFYVADAKGIVWAVSAGWGGSGWYVYAISVSRPSKWLAGPRVVSR